MSRRLRMQVWISPYYDYCFAHKGHDQVATRLESGPHDQLLRSVWQHSFTSYEMVDSFTLSERHASFASRVDAAVHRFHFMNLTYRFIQSKFFLPFLRREWLHTLTPGHMLQPSDAQRDLAMPQPLEIILITFSAVASFLLNSFVLLESLETSIPLLSLFCSIEECPDVSARTKAAQTAVNALRCSTPFQSVGRSR